ncbi:MAG: response regulator transcription factor, partial [Acidimicrobiales bacterium]|nr:response regulator transcription factor [Acidimicrobiales bacterium]
RRVLVVEDDAALRETLSLLLVRAGLEVTSVRDGVAALEAEAGGAVDLVLLDLMLPELDGFEVCRRLRVRSAVPIVVLTARDDTADIVRGLELGADDYLTKPFEPVELVARVRAALRRREATPLPAGLRFGDLDIDVAGQQAFLGGARIDLTATEFRLLVELARHAGQAMERPALLRMVWGYDYLGDSRLVDMAVLRLRQKLMAAGDSEHRVETVRGVGYRFEAAPPGR